MLLIENLDVGYNHVILEKLSLTLKNSSLTFLIGPNGVGKTTLLKTLAGIIFPLKGKIEKKTSISYLAQTPQIQKDITTLEYVLLACQHRGLFPSLDQEKKALQILEKMRIDPKIKLYYLSGGQLQKVQIAQAVFQESKILLLDEPFSNLDLKNQEETIQLLQSLVNENKSLLVTTHDLNLAFRYADEIWLMHRNTVLNFKPNEIGAIKDILEIPLYAYYCLDTNQYAWLNY